MKRKFPNIARKRQQAHTNRLLHMFSEPENELMVLNKEAVLEGRLNLVGKF